MDFDGLHPILVAIHKEFKQLNTMLHMLMRIVRQVLSTGDVIVIVQTAHHQFQMEHALQMYLIQMINFPIMDVLFQEVSIPATKQPLSPFLD